MDKMKLQVSRVTMKKTQRVQMGQEVAINNQSQRRPIYKTLISRMMKQRNKAVRLLHNPSNSRIFNRSQYIKMYKKKEQISSIILDSSKIQLIRDHNNKCQLLNHSSNNLWFKTSNLNSNSNNQEINLKWGHSQLHQPNKNLKDNKMLMISLLMR